MIQKPQKLVSTGTLKADFEGNYLPIYAPKVKRYERDYDILSKNITTN